MSEVSVGEFSSHGSLRRRLYILLCGAVLVLSAKILLIAAFGSSVPFWDEWEAQGDRLFLPLLEGKIPFSTMFSPHNEHRILFGRLVWLVSLGLSHQWDTILIMLINAVIHTAVVSLVAWVAFWHLSERQFAVGVAAVSFLMALPFGWENTLWAMQTVVYGLLLFSYASVCLLAGATAFSTRWWVGSLFGVCSYFCMAAGAATPAAAAAIAAVQILIGKRRGWKEYLAVAVQLLSFGAMVYFVPRLNYQDGVASRTVEAFVGGLLRYSSWPLPPHVLSALIINCPALILLGKLIWERAELGNPRWRVLALWLWTFVHILLFAYGRSLGDAVASRYQDIFLTGILINGAILFDLVASSGRKSLIAAFGLWLIVVVVELARYFVTITVPAISSLPERSLRHLKQVSSFLRDRLSLEGIPYHDLPFPSPGHLAGWLTNPTIRKVLPPQLSEPAPSVPGAFSSVVVDAEPIRHLVFVASPFVLFLSAVVLIWLGTTKRRPQFPSVKE